MVKQKWIAGVLALSLVTMTGAASVARAEAVAQVSPLSRAAAADITGGSWYSCLGTVAGVVLIAATGGTAALVGAGLLAAAAALGLSVYTVCECAQYIDDAVGTNFNGMCNGEDEDPPLEGEG